ncbi:MAG TPA: gamma-glutamylcyclotransferase [Beijerinckiaceae bacterium]|jgi:cation transport protein ChaC|nr:gamma-glutamylcyclotransferase [Beijerinckiaceae bacterium]
MSGVTTTGASGQDLWVFGYGSLMWRPGFDFVERQLAWLRGYHRALCIYSHVHRGTPERPGLVLGLDRGGSCRGVAFRVEAQRAAATIAYLRAREQVTAVYVERRVRVRLDDEREVEALTYVVDRRHVQYAGKLPLDKILEYVRAGVGRSGENPAYVLNTHRHLAELSLRDPVLAHLVEALGLDNATSETEITDVE